MICISLGETTVNETLLRLKNIGFAEIRLDKIEDLEIDDLERILNVNRSIIVTFRPGKVEEELRIQYLVKAIELGVKYIDIEIETAESIIKGLIKKAGTVDTKIVISYHNYVETLKQNALSQIVEKCKNIGADIVKIATRINNMDDNFELIRLLEREKNLIVIGMGKLGKISRIMSTILGSPFTFAALSEEKKTADGQITYQKMKKIIEDLT